MNRPFAYLGFSYLVGLFVSFFLPDFILFIFLFSLIPILIAVFKFRKTPLILSLSAFSLSMVFSFVFTLIFVTPYEDYHGKTADVTAYIVEIVDKDESFTAYNLEVFEVDEEEVSTFKVLYYSFEDFIFEPYDIFKGSIKFSNLDEELGFSYKNYLLGDGYKCAAFTDTSSAVLIAQNQSENFNSLIPNLRNEINFRINTLYTESSSDLINAMLLGSDYYLDDDIYSDFRFSGVSHILVVSGMHLAIIVGSIYSLLKKFNCNRFVCMCVLIPIIILYMFVSGFGSSVFRSAVMFIILLLSHLFGEESDSLNSLGFATLFICFLNPYSAVDIGFLLSVSATAGIIYLSPILHLKMMKFTPIKMKSILSPILKLVAVSTSALLFITPILVFTFGTINPLSLVSSIVLTLPSTLFLTLAALSVLISFMPLISSFTSILVLLVNLLSEFMISFCDLMANIGRKFLVLPENISILLLIGCSLIIFLAFLFKFNKSVKITSFILIMLIISSAYLATFINLNLATHIIINEDIILLIKNSKAFVISLDDYKEDDIRDILETYSISKIDTIFASDDLMPYNNIVEDFEISTIENINDKSSFNLFDNLNLDFVIGESLIKITYNDKVFYIDKIPIESQNIEADVCFIKDSSNLILTIENNSYTLENEKYYCLALDENIKIRSTD